MGLIEIVPDAAEPNPVSGYSYRRLCLGLVTPCRAIEVSQGFSMSKVPTHLGQGLATRGPANRGKNTKRSEGDPQRVPCDM